MRLTPQALCAERRNLTYAPTTQSAEIPWRSFTAEPAASRAVRINPDPPPTDYPPLRPRTKGPFRPAKALCGHRTPRPRRHARHCASRNIYSCSGACGKGPPSRRTQSSFLEIFWPAYYPTRPTDFTSTRNPASSRRTPPRPRQLSKCLIVCVPQAGISPILANYKNSKRRFARESPAR